MCLCFLVMDILDRLRKRLDYSEPVTDVDVEDAADEIERLRAENAELQRWVPYS
jgi:hypothetical protein